MKERPTVKWAPAYRAHSLRKSLLRCSYLTSAVCLVLLCGAVEHVWSFNLSPEAGVVFQGPVGVDGRGTYFGYAVGLRSRKENADNWLLVGAPRANLTERRPLTPVGLVEPGAMYICPVGTGGRNCRQLVLDSNGNIQNSIHSGELGYHDLKNHGWAGAAIDTQPGDDRQSSMVCAPRWKNQLHKSTLLMNGACYGISSDDLLTDGRSIKILSLTRFSKQNYQIQGSRNVFHYAHGELGISIHYPEMQDKVLLGAPGVFNWQGSVVELRDAALPPGSISRRKRQIYPQRQFNTEFVPNPYFTSTIEDSDYFGYSISSGRFVKDEVHYVAGAPRGADSMGKVLVFKMGAVEESELLILSERSGQQIGEYFGSSVTAVDVNNDGLADLIVGAPLYSQPITPDQGAAYVYKNNGGGQMALEGTRIEGSRVAGARFGHVVASPGDLNLDNYNDIMVGAPYEGLGAVYVYLGSVDGLQQQYSQKITPEQLPTYHSRPLEGFGISISRGVDIDDNLYPDVAVGSYVSGHAVLLRTRPVALIKGTISTDPSSLTIQQTSFKTKVCVTYKGTGVPEKQEVTVTVTLDHQRQMVAPRAVFVNTNTAVLSFNVTIHRNGEACEVSSVSVQKQLNNAPDPVGIRLQYWLANPALQPSEIVRQPKKNLAPNSPSPTIGPITSPVTDPSDRSGVTGFLSFVTGCEDDGDNSCSSDLKVTAWYPAFSESNPMVIGKQRRIKFIVKVENSGEPAFLPNITLSVKRPLDLILPSSHTCERLATNFPSIMCLLENPLTTNSFDSIEVEVDVEQMTDGSGPVSVDVTAGSSDIEVQPLDNFLSPALPLAADAKLQIHGASSDEQITYDRSSPSTINMTVTKNLTFTHVVTIVKRGPTPLGQVVLRVEIPVRDADNNTLLTIHSPKREFQGVVFPCTLSGAEWFTVVAGAAVNFTDTPDLAMPDRPPQDSSGGRTRRNAGNDPATPVAEKKDVPLVTCRAMPNLQCAVLTCTIGSWPHDSASATLSYKLNLNLTTLEPLIRVQTGTVLASHATASIMSLSPAIFFGGEKSASGLASTLLLPGRLPGEGIPWWWILLAVLLGLLLLSAMAYGLYKMGFFRRKEKEEMEALTATLSPGSDLSG